MLPTDARGLKRILMSLVRSSGVWAQTAPLALVPETETNAPDELDSLSDDKILVQHLAARWREVFMPHEMDIRYKKEWNLFLTLEVGFFFPLRRGGPLPANIGQIGVLLSDREQVALVIADGDKEKAASILSPKYEEFWKSIVPCDEALPYSTVNNRIDRAVRLLAPMPQGDRTLVQNHEAPRSQRCHAELVKTPVLSLHASALSRYLEFGLPMEPKFVPDEWRTLVEGIRLGRLTIIRGRTGTGKTELMKWLSHQVRREGATPLYVNLPLFAIEGGSKDILAFASTHAIYANRYRDPSSASALQIELAQEECRGCLVLFADCPDELFDSELSLIAAALPSFNHVIVGERNDNHLLDGQQASSLAMPRLHPASLATLIRENGCLPGLPFEVLDEIRNLGLVDNLALAVATSRVSSALSAGSQVRLGIEHWIDRRLKTTKQDLNHTVNLMVARKLLEIVARIEAGLEGPRDDELKLNPHRIEYAVRRLGSWVELEMGFEALSFLHRTGLVNPREISPVLSYPGVSRFVYDGTSPTR